jgi:hypothetical protein
MIYPGALDYDSAVKAPDKFLLDPLLRRARPVMRRGSSTELFQFSGAYARVYQFEAPGGRLFAFRCWIKDVGDEAAIYRGIDQYLKMLDASVFVDFAFLPEAILVNGTKYPGLRMNWIDAPSLQQFAYDQRNDSRLLQGCADSFLNVARYLHSVRVAHGDLQGDNIRVRVNSGRIQIKLIDYDTMYIPTVDGRAVTIRGLDSYQHPRRRLSEKRTEKDDYFSELVIYLALLALARSKVIRSEFKRPDKDLLFSGQDFKDPAGSGVFKTLWQVADPEVRGLTQALIDACRAPGIGHLHPLEEVIERVRRSQPTGQPPRSIFVDQANSEIPPVHSLGSISGEESVFSTEGVSPSTSKVVITDNAGLELREIQGIVQRSGWKAKHVSAIWITNQSGADIDVNVGTSRADEHLINREPSAFRLARGEKCQVHIRASIPKGGDRYVLFKIAGAQTATSVPLKLKEIAWPFATWTTVPLVASAIFLLMLFLFSPEPTPEATSPIATSRLEFESADIPKIVDGTAEITFRWRLRSAGYVSIFDTDQRTGQDAFMDHLDNLLCLNVQGDSCTISYSRTVTGDFDFVIIATRAPLQLSNGDEKGSELAGDVIQKIKAIPLYDRQILFPRDFRMVGSQTQ